jgi:hypothetical protein
VIDDYLAKPEAVFKWRHLSNLKFKTEKGNTAYVLNVTSLEYLDTSKVYGPKGSIWDHEVIIIVPWNILQTNISNVYLSLSCDSNNGLWVN